jgi:hypothetical protein
VCGVVVVFVAGVINFDICLVLLLYLLLLCLLVLLLILIIVCCCFVVTPNFDIRVLL